MMKIKKRLSLFILITILIISSMSVSSTVNNFSSEIENRNIPENYLIKDVPYYGQTGPYCAYAGLVMILRYYNKNISEREILHNSGVGFSLSYDSDRRYILSGVDTSLYSTDREFLAGLYNLSYEEWKAPAELTDEESWQEYWLRTKQNISNNIPVWTVVHPLYLISMRISISESLKLPYGIWNFIPDFLIKKSTSAGHAIVVFGFNESNQTVCYHDPGVALFNKSEYGNFVWDNLSDFKNAVVSNPKQTNFSYSIGKFQKSSNNLINKTVAYKLALERNIERMMGNNSVYDNQFSDSILGLNALKTLKKNFEPGRLNRVITIFKYKYRLSFSWMMYRSSVFLNKLFPNLVNLSMIDTMFSLYHRTAKEKHDISEYLWNLQFQLNDSYYSQICRTNSLLLELEAKNWDKLASNYAVFMKKGIFLSALQAILLMNKMSENVDDIIAIEEAIISSLS